MPARSTLMRRLARCGLGLALLPGAAGILRAEGALGLSVVREPGAEACPDAQALAGRIDGMRGLRERGHAAYQVTFSQAGEEFAASITAASSDERRTIHSRRLTCVALAEAVAVTLALLYDSDLTAEKGVPAAPDAAATDAAAPAPPAAAFPPAGKAGSGTFVAAGAAGMIGVLARLSPAVTMEIGLAGERWRWSAGALLAWPQDHTLGPGSVREGLVSSLARVCHTAARGASLRLDLCSGAHLGAMTGEGRGFTADSRRTRLYLSVPVDLVLGHFPSRSAGWEVSAGALVPVMRDDFRVDGLGTAYASPAVGGMLSLRLLGLHSW